MMKTGKNIDRVEEALKAARRADDPAPVSPEWHKDVMRHVHALGTAAWHPVPQARQAPARLYWRAAWIAAAAAAVIAVVGYIMLPGNSTGTAQDDLWSAEISEISTMLAEL